MALIFEWLVGPKRDCLSQVDPDWDLLLNSLDGIVVRKPGRNVVTQRPKWSVEVLGSEGAAQKMADSLGPHFGVDLLSPGRRVD